MSFFKNLFTAISLAVILSTPLVLLFGFEESIPLIFFAVIIGLMVAFNPYKDSYKEKQKVKPHE